MSLVRKLVIECGFWLAVCAGFVVLMVVLGLCWVLYDTFYEWPNRGVAASRRRGDQIIAALERHYDRHGRYPDDLTTLVPTDLEAIPQPRAGTRRWKYQATEDNQAFHLSFATSQGYPSCWYDRNRKEHKQGGEWYEDR